MFILDLKCIKKLGSGGVIYVKLIYKLSGLYDGTHNTLVLSLSNVN